MVCCQQFFDRCCHERVWGGGGERETVATGRADAPSAGAQRAVSVEFVAMAGSEPVSCGDVITNIGSTNATGGIKDLRFYIANVKLITRSGALQPVELGPNDDWNATLGKDRVTLIDLEDKTGACAGTVAMNKRINGSVADGDYVGITMTLGVPLAFNHSDQSAGTAVTPAVINNGVNPGMAWSWAGGRKFTRVELTDIAEVPTWTPTTYNLHLGSTDCFGSTSAANTAAGEVAGCNRPNRMTIRFERFDADTQRIGLDVLAFAGQNDVTQNAGGPSGCMSAQADPECNDVFKALGLDNATGSPAVTGQQRVFSVVAAP